MPAYQKRRFTGGKSYYVELLETLEGPSDFTVSNERIHISFMNDTEDQNRKRAILLSILSEETYALLRNLSRNS